MSPLLAWNNRRGRLLYRMSVSADLHEHISVPGDGHFALVVKPRRDGTAEVGYHMDTVLSTGQALAERGCLFQWVSTGPGEGRISVYLDLLHQEVIAAPSEAMQ